MGASRACAPDGRMRSFTSLTKNKFSKNLRVLKDAAKRRRKSRVPSKELEGFTGILINLDRRQDRLARCSAQLHEHCPWLRYQHFSASDGSKDVISKDDVTSSWNTARNVEFQKLRAIRKGWNDLDSYQVKQLTHSPGERGCSMSHIRAWKHCLQQAGNTNTPLLVLEDDAKPIKDFTEILTRAMKALPADAHVLYLGYSQAAEWRRAISPDLVESEYVWTTVGYIIWPSGARILLSMLPVDQPVDNFMATACANGTLRSYCVRPKIILQADEWNVSSDVGHSDEIDSDIKHSDPFYPGLRGEAGRKEDSVFFGPGSDSSDDSDDAMYV